MVRLSCGWCHKSHANANVLIAGLDVYICDECINVAAAQLAANGDSEHADGQLRCSFCRKSQKTLDKPFFKGIGESHVCAHCIRSCLGILEEKSTSLEQASTANTSLSDMHEDGETEAIELSPQEEEWSCILNECGKDNKQLLAKGKEWLRAYSKDPFAGVVIAKLIEITPTAKLLRSAEIWMAEFPCEYATPAVVAMLLKHVPTAKNVRLANRCMKLAKDPWQVRGIIREIVDGPYRAGLLKQLILLVERFPDDGDWRFALYSKSRQPNKRLDNLKAKWIRLNVNNPEIYLTGVVSLTQSPVVIEAAFEWARSRRGGYSSEKMSWILDDLLNASSRYHQELLTSIVSFARRWLRDNPDHVDSGKIYGSLICVTRSKTDIRNAKRWYAAHAHTEKAWFIISDLLSIAYWSSELPDEYAVEEAKLLLRQQKISDANLKPRLVGSLISVVQDEETVIWAKEVHSRTGLNWILSRLLLRAADQDCIERANNDFDNWIGSSVETEMLYSLLCADPEHKRALARAKVCVKKNPNDQYSRALAEFLKR